VSTQYDGGGGGALSALRRYRHCSPRGRKAAGCSRYLGQLVGRALDRLDAERSLAPERCKHLRPTDARVTTSAGARTHQQSTSAVLRACCVSCVCKCPQSTALQHVQRTECSEGTSAGSAAATRPLARKEWDSGFGPASTLPKVSGAAGQTMPMPPRPRVSRHGNPQNGSKSSRQRILNAADS